MLLSSRFAIAISATLLLAPAAALAQGVAAGSASVASEAKPAAAKTRSVPNPTGAKCVLAGGEANMITQGLAEFMAKAALKNSINGMGAKPAGPIKLDCSQNGALQYCKAAQRACK